MRRVLGIAVVAIVASVLVPGGGDSALSETIPVYSHFIGAMHEHSGYSDGFPGSEPRDYFESAKSFGLDFLGSSEHSDNADLPIVASEECLDETISECALAGKENPEDSFRKWDATREQADEAGDGSFTGFRGFEWTSDRYGHINVYLSENDSNAKAEGGYATMGSFWEWFLRSPTLGGGADGLATFNHPGDKDAEPLDGFNWNSFEYIPAADQRMVGLELYNDNDDDYEQYYIEALDNGWHVGAIGAEDLGHRPRDGDGEGDDDWGGPVWAKTVIVATDKSVSGLREAMLARRFYAVKDNTLRMALDADGQPMGSRISEARGARIPFKVDIWNEEFGSLPPRDLARVELVSNGGEVIASSNVTPGHGPDLVTAVEVSGTERFYFARVLDATGAPAAYSSPVWIEADEAPTREGEWLAGDLHIHTTYSHDSYGGPTDDNTGPDEFYTLGHPVTSQFAVAIARGLDYLAITDHNNIRSQADAGWQFATDNGLIPIPGYESSIRGHAQMLGAVRCYASTGSYDGTDCGEHGDTSAEGAQASAEALRADGGVFQANHPHDRADTADLSSWKYGLDVVPDTIEVWNISRIYAPPAPSATDNDTGIRLWERFLDLGYHVGATGGSDNHWVSTTAVQGAGQPTTWVLATDRTQAAILDGLRAGRTFVTHQPPNLGGPQLFLEGDADGDETFESIVGDTLPTESDLRVRVVGAPGSLLSLFTNGGEQIGVEVPVVGPDFTYPFTAPVDSTWVRAEIGEPDARAQRQQTCDGIVGSETTLCRNQIAALALTSAIYLEDAPEGQSGQNGPAGARLPM